ncbi:MAG: tetratricopeptide repeat protein, partial [Deltaproteobacteria bacterium]|nr:tetratricopeptide repeat protein [Deltaproteobacteria bacterium]
PQRVVLGLSAAAVICAFTISSARQLNHLQNSSTLFQHALSVTEDNYGAHNNLGLALAQGGKLDEAIDHYLMALEIKPVSPMILNNLGIALARQGRMEEAVDHFRKALEIDPNHALARYNLDLAENMHRRKLR